MANDFYRQYYNGFLTLILITIILMLVLAGMVLYQVWNRPLPEFAAVTSDGKSMTLVSRNEPNFLPETLMRWANKAGVAAYTFDFANYNNQLAAARPYFTEAGWENYRASISDLINSVVANQVFVNGVVVGPPVITNQGNFAGHDYAWRIQLPFLVTIQGSESTAQKMYTLVLTLVKVPTNINPVGIGIDQFVMTGGS